jgi:protein arginine N-methyltransferase 2
MRVSGRVCSHSMALMAEMLHHILSAPSSSEDHIALRAEDVTSAGDNMTFLTSKLTWETGEDGRERVVDADGNG